MGKHLQMLLLSPIFLLAPIVALGQLKISRIVSSTEADAFRVVQFQQAITRDNACTVTLREFAFSEIDDGYWCVLLKVAFMKAPDGGGEPIEQQSMRILFGDVIKRVKNDEVKLSISNLALLAFVPLRDFTHIKIEMRLEKVKEEFDKIRRLVRPILNVPQFSSQRGAFDLLDNVVSNMKSDENRSPLLYSATFYVPKNVAEYSKFKSEDKMPLLSNNEDQLILAEGVTPVNDGSILGFLKDLLNGGAKWVTGSEVIKDKTTKFGGLVRINFTKDANASTPSNLYDLMVQIKEGLMGPDGVPSSFKTSVSSLETQTAAAEQSKRITTDMRKSILQFVYLAKIYAEMKRADGAAGQWISQFRDWRTNVNTGGVELGMEALGMRGLYSEGDKVVRVYIPYGTEDEFRMAFYTWQKGLHENLADLREKGDNAAKRLVASMLETIPKELADAAAEDGGFKN